MKSHRQYLEDMLEYISYLESFHVDSPEALEDIKTQLAVRKSYEVLGEIIKRLPETVLQKQPHIPWKEVKGMRDILIHRYDDIDLTLLWDTLIQLPALRVAVEALLAELPPDENLPA